MNSSKLNSGVYGIAWCDLDGFVKHSTLGRLYSTRLMEEGIIFAVIPYYCATKLFGRITHARIDEMIGMRNLRKEAVWLGFNLKEAEQSLQT